MVAEKYNMIYWHIQMNQPWGRDGGTIQSIDMLRQNPPVIGTGEWDDIQCYYFTGENPNGLKLGDIVLVHEGQRPIALCKIASECFQDPALLNIYHHENFRRVKVLAFYNGDDVFPQPQGTLERLINKGTSSWKFINDWYNDYQKAVEMKKYIGPLIKKKQIILQGPPGTGKTYTAQDISYRLIFNADLSHEQDLREKQIEELENSEQFKFIQFHPSYTYEDFVRGIVAKPRGENGITYDVEEKLLGLFADKALRNLKDSQKPAEQISYENWVEQMVEKFRYHLDELTPANSGDLQLTPTFSIVATDGYGIIFQSKTSSYRDSIPYADLVRLFIAKVTSANDIFQVPGLAPRSKYRTSYWFPILEKFRAFVTQSGIASPVSTDKVPLKKFVMIIDEINRANLPSVLGELIYSLEYRDRTISSTYELTDRGNEFVIPSNLYIIGTMNTADRSVGHIDYAIRRRFAFIDILPNPSVITNDKAKEFFNEIEKIFDDYRAPDFEKDQVMLGHSYFLAANNGDLKMKLRYEVYPILKEYLNDGVLVKNDTTVGLLSELLKKFEALDE